MKQLVKNYSFDKTARTVTFTDFGSISLDRVYLVTNVTSNVVVYQFNNPSLGGTVSGNVLTLTYNTASMANTDKLQIIYDCTAGDPTYDATGTSFVVGNVASGATDSGNPVKVGGRYNATAPTLSDGQRGDLQLDASGNLRATLAVKLDNVNDSITTYPFGHAFNNITTNATTTVKSSSGVLHAILVGNAGSGETITLYDNTAASGTTIATITPQLGLMTLNLAFNAGLTVVTAGTTAGNITIIYR